MAAKYELYQDKRGEYRWRLRHQNGNIIADSAEGYSSKAGALNGIESVKKNVGEADIKEIATEPELKPESVIVTPSPPLPTPAPPAKFELYQDKVSEYRWRLRHQNGNIIADSAEGYSSKAGALNGIESVKKNVGEADIKEIATEPKLKPESVIITPPPKQEPPTVAVKPEPKPEPVPVTPIAKETPIKEASATSRPTSGVKTGGNNNFLIVAVIVLAIIFFVCVAGVLLASAI